MMSQRPSRQGQSGHADKVFLKWHTFVRMRIEHLSPRQFLLVVATTIFVAEFCVMIVLNHLSLPTQGFLHALEAVVDSTILLFFLSPLYFVFYRPFWEARQRYEEEITMLNRQLLRVSEEERKRVSHDLHDQCGQSLTTLQLGIETLKKKLPKGHQEQSRHIDQMIQLVAQLSHDIREVTHRLRPAMLDERGIFSAMEGLVEDYRRVMPGDVFKYHGQFAEDSRMIVTAEHEMTLFRVAQEALNNTMRHASASSVDVHFGESDGKLILEVRDNGVGFDLDRMSQNHDRRSGVGLIGMRERVADQGGLFRVETKPDEGTAIRVELPLKLEGSHD